MNNNKKKVGGGLSQSRRDNNEPAELVEFECLVEWTRFSYATDIPT